jgi:hypothetical protein
MRVNKKGLYINLILIAGLLVLISGCISQYHDDSDSNVTEFGIKIEIIFTNETFDGIWNGKVLSGRKGEQAMDWYSRQMNWSRVDEEKSAHSSGIDGIYRKGDNSYVFAEAKETSRKSDYDTPLSTDASYGAQMSDQWIEHHVVKINDSGMLGAFYDGNYDKLVVLYKIKDSPGSTITKDFAGSLNKVGVDHVVIIKNKGGNNN